MDYRISDSEYRFMQELWKVEPIKSTALVSICQEQFGWKKSTTYTVIKNLIEKGIIENKETFVKSIVEKDLIIKQESEDFLNRTFGGSIPDMFATFLKDRKLTADEVQQLKKIIEEA